MWSCSEAVFYFWSSTGIFPRPPGHNYFNMGGKHVSTVTANFSALFAVHSLTTVSLLEGFLLWCHLILGPLSEYTRGKSKQIVCFAEQKPFTRWSPQINQGKKESDEMRLLNHSVIPFQFEPYHLIELLPITRKKMPVHLIGKTESVAESWGSRVNILNFKATSVLHKRGWI